MPNSSKFVLFTRNENSVILMTYNYIFEISISFSTGLILVVKIWITGENSTVWPYIELTLRIYALI